MAQAPHRSFPRALAAFAVDMAAAGYDVRTIVELALSSGPIEGVGDDAERRARRSRAVHELGLRDRANTISALAREWLQAEFRAEAAREDLAKALTTGQVDADPETLRRAYLGAGA